MIQVNELFALKTTNDYIYELAVSVPVNVIQNSNEIFENILNFTVENVIKSCSVMMIGWCLWLYNYQQQKGSLM